VLPTRVRPYVLSVDPKCENPRSDIVLPIQTKSKIERLDPRRAHEYSEKLEPRREKLRSDMDDPNEM
jgi:hypothetical protein